MRSKRLIVENWLEYCKRIFGSKLPALDIAATNKKYGGLDIKGQNIIFTNAEEDPW
jgi:hypothetical protein